MRVARYLIVLGCIFVLISCSNKKINPKDLKGKVVQKVESLPVTGKSDLLGAIDLEKITNIEVLNKKYYQFEVISQDSNTRELSVKLKLNTKNNGIKTYENFKIKIPQNIPVEALTYGEKDYIAMIKKETPQLVKNINGKEVALFPIEEVANIYVDVKKNYPNLTNLSESNFERITEDFPQVLEILSKVSSYEEVLGIYQFISEVYNLEQVYEVNKTLRAKKGEFRETAVYDFMEDKYGLTEAERAVIFTFEDLTIKPYKAQAVKESSIIAKVESVKWANELGIGTGDTKADALRHTLWQYELSKIITEQTGILNIAPYDKKEGISFAEEFGAAREAKYFEKYEILKNNPLESINYDWLNASNRMDLHNNMVGREYFNSVVSAGNYKIEWKAKGKYLKIPVLIFPKLIEPSLEIVERDLKNKIENGVFIDEKDEKTNKAFYELGTNKFGIKEYSNKIIYLFLK